MNTLFPNRLPVTQPYFDNQILCSTFQEVDTDIPVTLTLTPSYLICQMTGQEQPSITLLYSDIQFKMLFSNKQFYGIEFKRKTAIFSVYSLTIEILRKWFQQLSRLLYQYSFHTTYKTLKKLGKGAFSTVYLVQRFVDKKVFAVKNFTKPGTVNTKSPEQKWLMNQLNNMKKLNHTSIVKLEGIFQETNNILAVIEYIDGKSLDFYCDDNDEKLQPHQVIDISKQLIEALIHMKQKGIVHRDLKPQNIILKPGLQPVIIDFGFSVDLSNIPQELRHACGTPGFIAPQIYKKQPLVFGSFNDVYSLGAIIYNLLYGPLHIGSSLKQIMDNNKTSNVPKHLKNSDIPIDRLIYCMLQKQPKNRISIEEALNYQCFKLQKKSINYLIDLFHS